MNGQNTQNIVNEIRTNTPVQPVRRQRHPMYEKVKKQNGERFARSIEQTKNGLYARIFNLPNLLNVIKYAGDDAEPILDLLLSLCEREEAEQGASLDPITYIFMAGYIPCYNEELTREFEKKAEAISPTRDENGNPLLDANGNRITDMTLSLEDAKRLADEFKEKKRELLAKERGVNPDEITNIDLYTVTSPREQNELANYFVDGERLCTFNDSSRHERNYMLNATKRNIRDIKREDFKNPLREDEYGTSILSIQIDKEGHGISLKNRYNHTVGDPDNTLNSNPDKIMPGFTNSLKTYLSVDWDNRQVYCPDYFRLYEGKVLKHHTERDGKYFGENFYFDNGIIPINRDSEMIIDEFILNHSKEGKSVRAFGYIENLFEKYLNDLIKDKNIEIKRDKKKSESILFVDGKEVLRTRKGALVSFTYDGEEIPSSFLMENDNLEELNLPNLKVLPQFSFRSVGNLKVLNAPKLEVISNGSLARLPSDVRLNTPKLIEKGYAKIGPSLVDLNRMYSINGIPNELYRFLEKETEGKKITTQQKGDEVFYQLDGKDFMHFKNGKLRALHVYSDKIPADHFGLNFVSDELEELYLHALKKLPEYSCSNAKNLKKVYAPKLEEIGAYSFRQVPQLQEFDAPNCFFVDENETFEVMPHDVKFNAPLIYDSAKSTYLGNQAVNQSEHDDKIMRGYVLPSKIEDVKINNEVRMLLQSSLVGRKNEVKFDEEGVQILSDGVEVAYLKKHGLSKGCQNLRLTRLHLDRLTDFDYNLPSIYSNLEELSLPNAESISVPGYNLKYQFLKKVVAPKIKEYNTDFLKIFQGINNKNNQIDVNEEALKNGKIHFTEHFVFKEKENCENAHFIAKDEKNEKIAELINHNIWECQRAHKKYPDVKFIENEGEISILLNGEEMAHFKDGFVTRLALDYITEKTSYEPKMNNNSSFEKLEYLSCKKLEKIGSNLQNCLFSNMPALKEAHFPVLKKVNGTFLTGVKNMKHLDLPKLEYISTPEIFSRGIDKISMPQLKTFVCEQGALETLKNIESPYFKKNYFEFNGFAFDKSGNNLLNILKIPYPHFYSTIQKELSDKRIKFQTEGDKDILVADGKNVLTFQNGQITEIHLQDVEDVIGVEHMPKLKHLECENAKYIRYSLQDCPELESVKLLNVVNMGYGCLDNLPKLREIVAPKLETIEDQCIKNLPLIEKLDFPELKTVRANSIVDMPAVKEICFQKLEKADTGTFKNLPELEKLNLSNILKVGDDFLENTPKLNDIKISMLPNKLQVLKNHKNRRELLKKMQAEKNFLAHINYAGILAK